MTNKNYFLSLTFIFCLLSFSFSEATIRFVSHTGSSTPPYTSWETAADSMQKCINYSVDGDTIIVANGIYQETLFVNKAIWLLGISMDSTIIDGRGLNGINYDYLTIEIDANMHMMNFTVIGKAPTGSAAILSQIPFTIFIENCKILDCQEGIQIGDGSSVIKNSFLINIIGNAIILAVSDTCNPLIEGNLIIMQEGEAAVSQATLGHLTITDNIMIGNGSSEGISVVFDVTTITIKNNIISGYVLTNINTRFATDTALVENNVTTYQSYYNSAAGSIMAGPESYITNNITANNNTGITGSGGVPESNYNLFWDNDIANTSGGVTIDSTDVLGDPMFVNDTVPFYGGSYDYHLQMFSPAIDSGDPNILDVDSSRSDIGAYGGPGGETYTYLDLPPRAPVNLNINVDSLVTLTWNRNSEADTAYYNVYRDTVSNFIIDSTKLVGIPTDTFFIQINPQNVESLYFKITVVDQQGNESLPSEEVGVLITSVNEFKPIVNDYLLYQNYPNPFNPSTKIGYKLKERGYVKLMVYDITGSLVSVLVNEVKEAGYYEVEFGSGVGSRKSEVGNNRLASGIYLYRIEVIGEGNIPRFSDLKKMILLK
jgi:hypothetical protein